MRHKGVRKDETKRKVLDAVSRGFRKHGIAGVGVDKLAKEAGVTSGAFYAHFGSKNCAFQAALNLGLDDVMVGIPKFQRENGVDWVQAFVDYYLGASHRDDLECCCAMTVLTPEVVRCDVEIHNLYESKMKVIVDLVAQGLQGTNASEVHARAWGLLGVLTGGLHLARAMASSATAEVVANAIKANAIQMAGPTKVVVET